MGASFNGKAYEEIYKHKDWEQTADKYEEEFAAKLYKTSYVQEAAKTALTKLSRMLNAYYDDQGQASNLDEQTAQDAAATQQAAAEIVGEPAAEQAAVARPADGGNDRVEITDTLLEALLPKGDSSGGAGQIGNYSDMYQGASEEVRQAAREIDEKNLNAVINGDGNLRERMTLLYNGTFINGGKDKEHIAASRSLKNLMAYITEEERERIPELQGVRMDLLEELSHRKSKTDVFETFSFARDLKNASDKRLGRGNRLTRFLRGLHRGYIAAISSKFTRKKRSEEERQKNRLGEEHYNRLGLELSGREAVNGLRGTELQWQEGRAWYKMRKRINAQGMLQTAGPSGTTLRMLGAYKLMGASLKELLYFRLALIAWMVTSKDHSLYEIMTGSQNAGITGGEDLSEPATMYMTVDPIPVDVLRQEFAPQQQFPHEIVYKLMLNELRDKRKAGAIRRNALLGRKVADTVDERDYLSKHLTELTEAINVMKAKKDKNDQLIQKSAAIKKIILPLIDKMIKAGTLLEKDGDRYKEMDFEEILNGSILETLLSGEEKEMAGLRGKIRSKTDEYLRAKGEEGQLQNDLEIYVHQKNYVNSLVETRQEKLSRRGYEETDDTNFTLYGRSRQGVMRDIGADANNAQAQDIALNIYTTGAFLAMTRGQKYWGGLGRRALQDERVDQYAATGFGSYEHSSSKEMADKEIADSIYNMVRISSRMAQDALEERGQNEEIGAGKDDGSNVEGKSAFKEHTFRGGKLSGQLRSSEGSVIKINSLMSSSKNIDKAAEYYRKSCNREGEDNSVLIEYSMKGKGAVDISGVSKVQGEGEVLIPANTEFKIVRSLRKAVAYSDGIHWEDGDNSRQAAPENNKFPLYGNVVLLEEVRGPGSAKREEKGRVAAMRREIREEYRQRVLERSKQAKTNKKGKAKK
ncbi:MAG: hypothetical protein HDR02_02545 [Lachnospiraceae bacterium]|nr:hypothetical protein [Lachnospiraceae bacterium]